MNLTPSAPGCRSPLDIALLPITRASGTSLPKVVTRCDSLKPGVPDDHFDLVIGNPPYGRVTLSPADRARFKRSLFGHAKFYGLFTDMALRWFKRDGIIAYVTPTSFLAGEYFKNLRAMLGRDAPPATIDLYLPARGSSTRCCRRPCWRRTGAGRRPAPAVVHEITPANGAKLAVRTVGTDPFSPIPCSPGCCRAIARRPRSFVASRPSRIAWPIGAIRSAPAPWCGTASRVSSHTSLAATGTR